MARVGMRTGYRRPNLIAEMIEREDQCQETRSGYWTREEVEQHLRKHCPDDQQLAHYEQYLVLMGRAYGGYDGDQESVNDFHRNHLNLRRIIPNRILPEEIRDLGESLLHHPSPAKYWAVALLAGNLLTSVPVVKLMAESEFLFPVCLAPYLASRLRTGLWMREEFSYRDAGEQGGPIFTLWEMQQCDALGLFPREHRVTQSPAHPMRYLATKSRNREAAKLVDDSTVLQRLDQFMIRPEILAEMQEDHDVPIMSAILVDKTAVSGSFLAWALTDRARADHSMSKEEEMCEYYHASDLDVPTMRPAKEVAEQIASVLEDLFGGTATLEHRPFLKIFIGAKVVRADSEVLDHIPKPYRAMECRIIRQGGRSCTLPGIDFPAEIADKIQIAHPALLREIQVYHTGVSAAGDSDPLDLFGHVVQYHFECVRGMLTSDGVRLSFLAAAALIHGAITSPWSEELPNSVRCCAKYVRRGFQMYYRQEVTCPELLDALGDLGIVPQDAELPMPYPDDDNKDHIFQTMLTRPKRAIR